MAADALPPVAPTTLAAGALPPVASSPLAPAARLGAIGGKAPAARGVGVTGGRAPGMVGPVAAGGLMTVISEGIWRGGHDCHGEFARIRIKMMHVVCIPVVRAAGRRTDRSIFASGRWRSSSVRGRTGCRRPAGRGILLLTGWELLKILGAGLGLALALGPIHWEDLTLGLGLELISRQKLLLVVPA